MYSASCSAQQSPAKVTEFRQSFPTYEFSDPSPIPLIGAVYPYFRYDGFSNTAVQKSWKVVQLENDYIKLLILPEIGGKIWAAIEKSTNQPFLYYNHAVKFRDIAMRGPWTSGGLEANYGIIGHTPNCATPVDYITQTHSDGSVSCIIGALDLLTRTYWRMEINLPADKAYFTTKTFWYNTTPVEQPYYHWMNAGLPAKGNLEFIYPGNKYLGHEGEFSDWPVNKKNGKNINWYEANNFGGYKSYHVFGKYTNFSGAYWHDSDLGMIRFGDHDGKAGKKIWIWGLSRQGMIWEQLLTDTDGQYVELQSGRLFNQNAPGSSLTPFKHRSFAPYETDVWKEYWYPVLRTGGIVEASEWGALNVSYEKNKLKLYLSPVQKISDSLQVMEGDKIIYSRFLQLKPLQVFADSFQATIDPNRIHVMVGKNKINYRSDTLANSLSRPVTTPADMDWNNAYGLFILGKEAMDQKNYPLAEEKLMASLVKDPNLLPALVKLSELFYRNMRYNDALVLAKKALSVDTHDGSANFYYGLIQARLGNNTDAKDGFDLATLSPEYRSAAYACLSNIYLHEDNADKALRYAKDALESNTFNIDALQMEALIYRYLHQPEDEKTVLTRINDLDPLNHFTRFENYKLHPTEETRRLFSDLIRNELPVQTYLELAIWYYEAGFREEAEELLRWCPADAEADYWLAFLHHQPLDFSKISPDRVFPFRSETGMVLEELLKSQNHWLLKYHLALIYKDRNRVAESRALLAACGNEPGYAPFYAARAAINKEIDDSTSLHDLERAQSLDPQWRYSKLLTEWLLRHEDYEQALTVVGDFYKGHPTNYIMGMLYAKVLLLNKKYDAADGILTKLNIIPFEGAVEGRELYREAKLMQAEAALEKKSYKGCLEFLKQARLWPENLGVGKPFDAEIDGRLENWLEYQCYLGLKKNSEAEASLQQITSFEPRVDNTVKNFFGINTLITAWAYEKLGQEAKAKDWLNEQVAMHPDSKIIAWCRKKFEEEKTVFDAGIEKERQHPCAGTLDEEWFLNSGAVKKEGT